MKAFTGIVAMILVSWVLIQCSPGAAKAEAENKPLTPTEKLVADLKAEYGAFGRTSYDSSQRKRFIEYGYKGGLDKPDLFKRSINKSLNTIGQKVSNKYDFSTATIINLDQYVWETPQYKVNLSSSVKVDEAPVEAGHVERVKMDSVYVRLWIEE